LQQKKIRIFSKMALLGCAIIFSARRECKRPRVKRAKEGEEREGMACPVEEHAL
jgi:hypothetical protein